MKGIIFTEFSEMVENMFGMDTLDVIIKAADLPNDGAYTTTCIYDHTELIRLVTELSKVVGTPVSDLTRTFGRQMLKRFAEMRPSFFERCSDPFSFLESVDKHIHIEVRKLHPRAELPHFDCQWIDDQTFEMLYQSKRPFADLAYGLIEETFVYFATPVTIERVDHASGAVVFRIRKAMKFAS